MVDAKITTFLRDWTVRYVRNRDLITKKIVSIEERDGSFKVTRSDKTQEFFIVPFIEDAGTALKDVKSGEGMRSIVCFHTKQNFDAFMKEWNVFVEAGRNVTVYFVNPFSRLDRVLVIAPYTHNLVSDEATLEQGLKTMAESVEFTTAEEVKKIINT